MREQRRVFKLFWLEKRENEASLYIGAWEGNFGIKIFSGIIAKKKKFEIIMGCYKTFFFSFIIDYYTF